MAAPPASPRSNPAQGTLQAAKLAPGWLAAIERRLWIVTYRAESQRDAGGKFMQAHLGPDSFEPRRNDFKANLPAGIKAAREKYPKCGFRAGHLLNRNLGGNGKNPRNFTILRASAYVALLKRENAIARACRHLREMYEVLALKGPLVSDVSCCIAVRVTVGRAKWGDEAPDSLIAQRVTIVASVLREPELAKLIHDPKRLADATGALRRVKTEVGKANGVVVNKKPA